MNSTTSTSTGKFNYANFDAEAMSANRETDKFSFGRNSQNVLFSFIFRVNFL